MANLTVANGRGTNGGAIYNEAGMVNVTNCTFVGNIAVGGGGTGSAPNGADGFGGAIYNAGTLTASRCCFCNNSATGGPSLETGDPYMNLVGSGGAARGGAIANLGTLTIVDSLFDGNQATGGAGGNGWDGGFLWAGIPGPGGPGGNGGHASGAAIYNAGTASLVNCTLVNHACAGGNGGFGGSGQFITLPYWPFNQIYGPAGSGGNGGDGCGAIDDTTGSCALTNCTLAFNRGTFGSGGGGAPSGTNGASCGGLRAAGCQLVNTLLATNSPGGNALGVLQDLGHNLNSDGSGAFTNTGSLNNLDPKLGPLSNSGGPTLTLPLLAGSPAIDAADTASAPATDQRGFPRPAGAAADIGAYEYGSPAIVSLSLASGADVAVYGLSGRTCYLFTSTDLTDWTAVATNQIGTSWTTVFHSDRAAACRFFRATLP
jgi:hypothetical protein